jgi:intracellular septation protein A
MKYSECELHKPLPNAEQLSLILGNYTLVKTKVTVSRSIYVLLYSHISTVQQMAEYFTENIHISLPLWKRLQIL